MMTRTRRIDSARIALRRVVASRGSNPDLATKQAGLIEIRAENHQEWSPYSLARATGLSRATAGQMLQLLCP
jgi:hypothetical protein